MFARPLNRRGAARLLLAELPITPKAVIETDKVPAGAKLLTSAKIRSRSKSMLQQDRAACLVGSSDGGPRPHKSKGTPGLPLSPGGRMGQHQGMACFKGPCTF